MNETSRSAETLLLAAYREQAAYYASALAAAEQLRSEQGGGDDPGRLPPAIVGFLDKIAAIDARVAETKAWWMRAGQRPGPELRAALDEVTRLIDRLAGRVREAERTATASRQALTPELDAVARGVQMRRAYGGVQTSLASRSLE
jgi:hypothetical protein